MCIPKMKCLFFDMYGDFISCHHYIFGYFHLLIYIGIHIAVVCYHRYYV